MTKLYFTLALTLLVACADKPTKTGTVCAMPDPEILGYTTLDDPSCTGDNCTWGKTFFDTYCIQCHDSALKRPMRNGAPVHHDYNTLLGILETPDHIDEQAGAGPNASNHFMPPDRCPSTPGGSLDSNCPQPTEEERETLSMFIACERDREHNF